MRTFRRRDFTPMAVITAEEWAVASAAIEEYRRRQQVTVEARIVPEPKTIAPTGIRFYRPGE